MKSGEWRCQMCDESIEDIDNNPKHKDCPTDLTPGAYWCPNAAKSRNPGKLLFSLGVLLLSLMLGSNVANAQAQSVVTGFALWDAATDTVIDLDFKDGDHVPFDKKDCVAIEVKVFHPNGDGSFGSIRKQFDGLTSTQENKPPMAWEDDGGSPTQFNCAASMAASGPHRLTVTPFDGDNWTGLPGVDKVVNFVTKGPPPSCQPTGLSLECPGHGTIVRCEVPPDAQAVADRQILLRLYINGAFKDYPAAPHFLLDEKVYTDWPVQLTDDIYLGTCINHLLENPCTEDISGNVQPPGCVQDEISESMELGYSYGQPLPESGMTLMIIAGLGLILILSWKGRK